MLAELAAANAAFAVIKKAVQNGGDLLAAGNKLFEYFDNKAVIQQKSNAKGGGSDHEEFMALEALREQEEFLRESMIYAGRPGMWDDWLRFQADAAKRRAQQHREAVARKKRQKELIIQILWWSLLVVVLACAAAVSFFAAELIKMRR